VFHKRHTAKTGMSYDDAVEEAICFGWIDSLVRWLDADRYARKFTPRKLDSRWSVINVRRYAALEKRGALAAAGRARPPTDQACRRAATGRCGPTSSRPSRRPPPAWQQFNKLTASEQRVPRLDRLGEEGRDEGQAPAVRRSSGLRPVRSSD
jgi:hypothetical protein